MAETRKVVASIGGQTNRLKFKNRPRKSRIGIIRVFEHRGVPLVMRINVRIIHPADTHLNFRDGFAVADE
ncbi:MAG: hypothetical protein HQ507_00315 [Candidatus Marinimicrobia bacterium]|nr:hypothetical protein [Candidatus Neomarinimicrobiota bacterium]